MAGAWHEGVQERAKGIEHEPKNQSLGSRRGRSGQRMGPFHVCYPAAALQHGSLGDYGHFGAGGRRLPGDSRADQVLLVHRDEWGDVRVDRGTGRAIASPAVASFADGQGLRFPWPSGRYGNWLHGPVWSVREAVDLHLFDAELAGIEAPAFALVGFVAIETAAGHPRAVFAEGPFID